MYVDIIFGCRMIIKEHPLRNKNRLGDSQETNMI